MTTGILRKVDGYVLISPQINVGNGNGVNKSTLLVKNLYSVDNTQSLLKTGSVKEKSTMILNKQGSLFLGMPKMAMPMKPGYIRSLSDERRGIDTSVKYQGGSVYNPLNKQGNPFQGIHRSATTTRPGFIRSLTDEQRGVNNAVKYQGGDIYNPLNKHGNSFQGIPRSAMPTQPGFIKSLADELRGVNNTVKYKGGPIYNPLNKHGNAFQGIPTNMKKEFMEAKDISKNNDFSMDFDEYLFEDYLLFPESNKIEENIESSTHEDNKYSFTFKDNKPYYQISF